MPSPIDPSLLRVATELYEAWTRITETEFKREGSTLKNHGPVGLTGTTIDGTAFVFYEEGIDFYPKPENGDDR